MTTRDLSEYSVLVKKIEHKLVERYGLMVGGKDLWQALGYRSGDAFRQAICRNTIPIPIFPIKTRRGKFALSMDIAKWLAQQRLSITEKDNEEANMD